MPGGLPCAEPAIKYANLIMTIIGQRPPQASRTNWRDEVIIRDHERILIDTESTHHAGKSLWQCEHIGKRIALIGEFGMHSCVHRSWNVPGGVALVIIKDATTPILRL